MLLQVAHNKNFIAANSYGRSASKVTGDRTTISTIAINIMKNIRELKASDTHGVVDDPILKDYLGDATKGMEFGRIPVQTYLQHVATHFDIIAYCDEYFRVKRSFFM